MDKTKFVREMKHLFSNEYLDSIPHEVPETVASKKAFNKFKTFLRGEFPDCEIQACDCYCSPSATLSKNGKFVYISIRDLRWTPNWEQEILYRTCKDFKDSCGGYNCWSSIEDLTENVNRLLEV